MVQSAFSMLRSWTLGLACLVLGCTTVYESSLGTNAASVNHSSRKTCLETEFSCCGEKAFNPAAATCCKVEQGDTIAAPVTEGLSQEVSCCGLKVYNSLSETCCDQTVVAKPGPKARCCDKEAYDPDKQMCCGPIGNRKILTREFRHQLCCGQNQFNNMTHCCCDTVQIELINSSCCVKKSESALAASSELDPAADPHLKQSNDAFDAHCEGKIYDPDKQMCCGPIGNRKILTREFRHQLCCGQNQFNNMTHCCCDTVQIELINSSCCVKKSAHCEGKIYDPDKQMCCGPIGSKKILTREFSHQLCCGQNQFNNMTHCCCDTSETLHIELINSSCCDKKSGIQQQKPGPQPNCTELQTSLCGSLCYNPNEFRCCERNQTKCTPVSKCCRQTPYGLAQHRALCRTRTEVDGEESLKINAPYNPVKWTTCCFQLHGSPGPHCCGTEVYQPDTEICCHGHRHPKDEDTHCCGIHAYHGKNQHKCCDGTLYNLSLLGTLGHEARCCGSALQKSEDVCCMSALHQPGHHHKKIIKESRLESVNNLNESDLCEEMLVGTVEAVSLHCIFFSSVFKIHGRSGSVNPVDSLHSLETPDHCNSPKVFPGKTYSFDEDNVFIDFNHDSILQSIHLIMSKCRR